MEARPLLPWLGAAHPLVLMNVGEEAAAISMLILQLAMDLPF